MKFGAVIIGDELLSGKRKDRHFEALTGLLKARGLRLSWVQYLGDDLDQLTETFKRSFENTQCAVFSFGGIGNTPDDFTRQAVANALKVPLCLHPDAAQALKRKFGDDVDERRLLLGTFPEGAAIIPNPFNGVPGFSVAHHYFVPGFPQMAHPMIEWVLDSHYVSCFQQGGSVDRALLLTGEGAYESALLDLMQRVVQEFPDLRLFSLPSVNPDGGRRHLELGVEGAADRVEEALSTIRHEVEARGINWEWRPD